MQKRIRFFTFILAMVFLLCSAGLSLAEDGERTTDAKEHTEHFSYQIPAGWLCMSRSAEGMEEHAYFAESLGSYDGGVIEVIESELNASCDGLDVPGILHHLVDTHVPVEGPADSAAERTIFSVNGMDAISVVQPADGTDVLFLIVLKDPYYLLLAYGNSSAQAGEFEKEAQAVYETIEYLDTLPVTETECMVGDTVRFGRLEQDGDSGSETEEIEWTVLERKEGKALLISKYCLDVRHFEEKEEFCDWEHCSLRSWLNGEFLDGAFDAAEQEKILTTKVPGEKKAAVEVGEYQENDTEDKVFLLSAAEAVKYFPKDADRKAKPTPSLAGTTYIAPYAKGHIAWWLRTTVPEEKAALFVRDRGEIERNGTWVGGIAGVRPALWIDVA